MNRLKIFKLLISTVCVQIFYLNQISGEKLTETTEMEDLLETEAYYISNLESYIASQDEKITFLKR